MNLLLLGPPGAGKGTQAAILEAQAGLKHIASGELLRRHILSETHLGSQANAYVSRGELVPDELVIGMILDRICKPDCATGVIFDGFPRTKEQARALVGVLGKHHQTLDSVMFLTAPRDLLLKRIAGRQTCPSCETSYNRYFAPSAKLGICDCCGGALTTRADDTLETACRRLDVYLHQTLPLVEHFRQQGLLHEVDGSGEVQEVARRILHAVSSSISHHRRASHALQRVAAGAGGTLGSPAYSRRP